MAASKIIFYDCIWRYFPKLFVESNSAPQKESIRIFSMIYASFLGGWPNF